MSDCTTCEYEAVKWATDLYDAQHGQLNWSEAERVCAKMHKIHTKDCPDYEYFEWTDGGGDEEHSS